jgi:hypothetical protein
MAHFINTARLHIDLLIPGFSDKFLSAQKIDELYTQVSSQVCQQHYNSAGSMQSMLE